MSWLGSLRKSTLSFLSKLLLNLLLSLPIFHPNRISNSSTFEHDMSGEVFYSCQCLNLQQNGKLLPKQKGFSLRDGCVRC
ncbi:hypothetical protein C1H46_035182 [Malus baccata]|uniref:Uncharacterized protein n=1 Tax=Malus baccata TaxID=106549 RepID=A0A540KYH5_MALBA|nr:hypothetical protein C1H46_035182 [Malus baccata]